MHTILKLRGKFQGSHFSFQALYFVTNNMLPNKTNRYVISSGSSWPTHFGRVLQVSNVNPPVRHNFQPYYLISGDGTRPVSNQQLPLPYNMPYNSWHDYNHELQHQLTNYQTYRSTSQGHSMQTQYNVPVVQQSGTFPNPPTITRNHQQVHIKEAVEVEEEGENDDDDDDDDNCESEGSESDDDVKSDKEDDDDGSDDNDEEENEEDEEKEERHQKQNGNGRIISNLQFNHQMSNHLGRGDSVRWQFANDLHI